MILGSVATLAIASVLDAKAATIIDVAVSGGNVNAVLQGAAIFGDLFVYGIRAVQLLSVHSESDSRLWAGGGVCCFRTWIGAGMSGPSYIWSVAHIVMYCKSGSSPPVGIAVSGSPVGGVVSAAYHQLISAYRAVTFPPGSLNLPELIGRPRRQS